MKIIDKNNRSKLGEGRNYGMGYSVLTKHDDSYNATMAFTACKDYLNDLIFGENHKISETKPAYGFKHKYQELLTNDYVTFGLTPLHYNREEKNEWDKYNELKDYLLNYNNVLLDNINKFEERLGFNNKTELEYISTEDNVLVLKSPVQWFKSGPSISIYTLYIRSIVGLKESVNLDNYEITKNCIFYDKEKYNKSVKSVLDLNSEKVEKLFNHKHKKETGIYTVHGYGVVTYLSKLKEN